MRALLTGILVSCLLAATGFATASDSSITITLDKPAKHWKADAADKVPKTMEVGKTVVVDQEFQADFTKLFKANIDSDNGQCQATCPHEVGGIVCPTGKTAACGCPGGYLSC